MNGQLPLFDLIALPFELYLHKHHAASSWSKNQKAYQIF
jgi:hypothetical protein